MGLEQGELWKIVSYDKSMQGSMHYVEGLFSIGQSTSSTSLRLFFSFKYFHWISSAFADLPDMTGEYIDLSVCSNWFVVLLIVFNIICKSEMYEM